jgi:hypothetical protein
MALGGGCEEGDSSSQSAVAATAEKTADAGGAHVFVTGATSSPEEPGGITAEGVIDGARGRMTLPSGSTEEPLVIAWDGTTYYIDPSPSLAKLPGGKQWVRIDVTTFSPGDSEISDALQLLQSDPARILEFVSAGIEDVEEVGPAEVRGVETTHYRGTVNVARAADAAEGAEELRDGYRMVGAPSITEFEAEVWIDGDGVCRRLSYEIPITRSAGGGAAKVTIEFYDFGSQVEVAPPSEEDVFDLPQQGRRR